MSLHYDRGWCCSHQCLVETSDGGVIYVWHIKLIFFFFLMLKYGLGAMGLFRGHETNSSTHWSRSGHPPNRRRRCTGTRWLCQCRCLHCCMGYSHSRWCLEDKKKNDEKNARLRMRFCKSQPHISRIVASCILCCVCGIWSYSRGSKCLWSPPGTRSWTGPRPGSGSGREVHTHSMKWSALLPVYCWTPQQQCSCQSLQRGETDGETTDEACLNMCLFHTIKTGVCVFQVMMKVIELITLSFFFFKEVRVFLPLKLVGSKRLRKRSTR